MKNRPCFEPSRVLCLALFPGEPRQVLGTRGAVSLPTLGSVRHRPPTVPLPDSAPLPGRLPPATPGTLGPPLRAKMLHWGPTALHGLCEKSGINVTSRADRLYFREKTRKLPFLTSARERTERYLRKRFTKDEDNMVTPAKWKKDLTTYLTALHASQEMPVRWASGQAGEGTGLRGAGRGPDAGLARGSPLCSSVPGRRAPSGAPVKQPRC